MTFKFTPEQEAWLQTLERDDMQDSQTTGRLIDVTGRMCVLGVACSIQPELERCGDYFKLGVEEFYTTLPPIIAYRLKLRDTVGHLSVYIAARDTTLRTLAGLNDIGKMTFKEIAAYIRSNPENVFVKGAE